MEPPRGGRARGSQTLRSEVSGLDCAQGPGGLHLAAEVPQGGFLCPEARPLRTPLWGWIIESAVSFPLKVQPALRFLFHK